MSSSTQGLTDLQAAVASVVAQDALVVTALTSLNGQISSLQTQVTQLQAQLAAGTEVTDAQLEVMAQTLDTAEATVTAALPAPVAAPAPATPPASS